MKKLEKERRFLVKLPLNEAAQKIIAFIDVPIEIKQTYLQSSDGTVERVRSASAIIWKIRFNHFYHTKKKHVSSGVNEEDENNIKELQYEELLKKADPERLPIEKTRYMLPWNDGMFELDLFHGANEGLAILEIELGKADEMTDKIILPSYLEIEKEITGDDSFSNYNLAKKK